MEEITRILNDYKIYLLPALGLVILWVIVKFILNRPNKEERAHRERFDRLKNRQKDRYRDLRPLK